MNGIDEMAAGLNGKGWGEKKACPDTGFWKDPDRRRRLFQIRIVGEDVHFHTFFRFVVVAWKR
jgi:hypothetical protein